MNKRKNRLTPFKGKYHMPLDQFCETYMHKNNEKIEIREVMRRMNTLNRDDFGAVFIPTSLKDTSADKIRRAFKMLDMNWSYESIDERLGLQNGMTAIIAEMDSYMKSVFVNMDQYFYLNPENIDLDKVFVEIKK